eukprot:tig00001052_g6618.t1
MGSKKKPTTKPPSATATEPAGLPIDADMSAPGKGEASAQSQKDTAREAPSTSPPARPTAAVAQAIAAAVGLPANAYEEPQDDVKEFYNLRALKIDAEAARRDYSEKRVKAPSWQAAGEAFRARLQAAAQHRIGAERLEEMLATLTGMQERECLAVLGELEAGLASLHFLDDEESLRLAEQLAVTQLGSPFEAAREAAVRILNAVYDGHDWQLGGRPLEASVRAVGEPFAVMTGIRPDDPSVDLSRVVLEVFGPSYDFYSSELLLTQHALTIDDDGFVTVDLKPFPRAGFFDWRLARIGGVSTQPFNLPAGAQGRVRGRFVVLPRDVRSEQIHEVVVDMQDGEWDRETGAFVSRGDFARVREALPRYKADGITTVYLMGALERDNVRTRDGSFPRPDASPLALVDRVAANGMAGGPAGLREVADTASALGMKVVVDATDFVSAFRASRKYEALFCSTLDERGRKVVLENPTDGVPSAVLNYRKLATWETLVAEILALSREYGVHGVRLERGHSWPQLFEANFEELMRMDPAPQGGARPHYEPLEVLEACVVKPALAGGYWRTAAAAAGYANPLLAKLARAVWAVDPEFLLLADCDWAEVQRQVALSGCVPHSARLAQTIAGMFGRSLEKHGPIGHAEKHTSAEVRAALEQATADLPEGYVGVQSICTHALPYPALSFDAGAWVAADLLFLLPDVPMTFIGEDEGRAYRAPLAGLFAPPDASEYVERHREPAAGTPTRHLAERYMKRVTSATKALQEMQAEEEQAAENALGAAQRRLAMSRSMSYGNFGRAGLDAEPAAPIEAGPAAGRRVGGLPAHTLELLNRLRESNARGSSDWGYGRRRAAAPEIGYGLDLIKVHYDARRDLRKRLGVLQRGALVALEARHKFGTHDRVVAFARHLPAGATESGEAELVLVAVNLNDVESIVTVDCGPLEGAIGAEAQSGDLEEVAHAFEWVDLLHDDVPYDPEDESRPLFTRDEVLHGHNFVTLQPFSTACWRLVRRLATPALQQRLLHSSVRRLRVAIDTETEDSHNHVYATLRLALARKDVRAFAKWLDALAQKCGQVPLRASSDGWPTGEVIEVLPLVKAAVEMISRRKGDGPALLATYSAYVTALCRVDGEGPDLPDDGTLTAFDLARELHSVNSLGPIVFVTPELGKWSTVGGLGVMVDELSVTLAEMGADVYVVSPYYNRNRKGESDYLKGDGIAYSKTIAAEIGGERIEAGVHEGTVKGVRLFFMHNHVYFPFAYNQHNASAEYRTKQLAFMAKGALEVLCAYGIHPAVVCSNDWFTGLTAAYAKHGHFGTYFNGTSFMHIVHNLDPSYEGRFYPKEEEGTMDQVHRLPTYLMCDTSWERIILNPSRCAILASCQWGTVSRSYREDLLRSSPLSGLLRNHAQPFGFPNGIPVKERERIMREKVGSDHNVAKGILQTRYFGYGEPDLAVPLFAFVGRITEQKGVHLIANAIEELIGHFQGRVQFLVGGKASDDDPYSKGVADKLHYLRHKYPYAVWAAPGEFFTDGPLVNLGADFGLMPSLFEPGGIVQQEFFVAGTPVIAFKTGGLKDTVHEYNTTTQEGNGFTFEAHTHGDLVYAVKRAQAVFADPAQYATLRARARASVIDAEEVAMAWYAEFARLRGKVPAMRPKEEDLGAPEALEEVRAMRARGPEPRPPQPAVFFLNNTRARTVQISGSWDAWAQKISLERGQGAHEDDWIIALNLPAGSYVYKFIVDGEWKHVEGQPTVRDSAGIVNNLKVVVGPTGETRKKFNTRLQC